MTTLVVEDLKTTLTQDFEVLQRRTVTNIRPYLVFANDPSGTYTITVKDGATALASKSLTMAEIISGGVWNANEYHYGFINFDLDNEAILNTNRTYTIEYSSSGYTFDLAAYTSWIKPHEDLINTTDETITTDSQNPFGFQLWGFV